MIVVLLDAVDGSVLDQLLDDNVLYRPDLLNKPKSVLNRTLVAHNADAVITTADLTHEHLRGWLAIRPSTFAVRVFVGKEPPPAQSSAESATAEGAGHHVLSAYGAQPATAYLAAFEVLEREASRRTLRPFAPLTRSGTRARADRRVVMVGAGLVNLVCAHTLQSAGYDLVLVDEGPDPRGAAPWTAYGCSRGGDDARMYSRSEMNNYHDRQVSRTMNHQFGRSVEEQGWNVSRAQGWSRDEQRWVDDFESLPTWLAHRYNWDIFGFNLESHQLWERWKNNDPALFHESLLREGIVRLFSDATDFERKAAIQQQLGACRRLLSVAEIADEHPALAHAARSGLLAGGIDEDGFTVMAHRFMNELLDRLSRAGAQLYWNVRAEKLLFNSRGKVRGCRIAGSTWEAGHYVISPGVYGNSLLEGTRSYGQIHGVLGVWLRLPNTEPQLFKSLKLKRKGHVTEPANITIAMDAKGTPLLILGSGYGYTGLDPQNIDQTLLGTMYRGVIDTARTYFPEPYQAAVEAGGVEATLKYCVRPWTATGLGLFEIIETDKGGRCIVTGGHNTGGFAQAPAVGQAVLAALEDREHLMHYLYHPNRAGAFRGSNVPVTK